MEGDFNMFIKTDNTYGPEPTIVEKLAGIRLDCVSLQPT
jgi:hypothetical protein